jgi:hypothetical protein
MGKEQLLALMNVLQAQVEGGPSSPIIGTWVIHYDKGRQAFSFDKCEFGEYCEERPAIISLSGEVLDAGGPLFADS